jgi:hypothetical protein
VVFAWWVELIRRPIDLIVRGFSRKQAGFNGRHTHILASKRQVKLMVQK